MGLARALHIVATMAGVQTTDRGFDSNAACAAGRGFEFGLQLEGSALELLIHQVEGELRARQILVAPRFYLSTDWGVTLGSTAVAIPYELAAEPLSELLREQVTPLEGDTSADMLKYLRHAVGHVVGYAFRLYERPEWIELFGAITEPHDEERSPALFSQSFVHHLPGGWAQKHPDEDWAETFAVWLTPGRDWAREYGAWPQALRKLEYCARVMRELRGVPPEVVSQDTPGPLLTLPTSLDIPGGIDAALANTFERAEGLRPVGDLVSALEDRLSTAVYRWTLKPPAHTRLVLRAIACRARELGLGYADEHTAVMQVTGLVTALVKDDGLRVA